MTVFRARNPRKPPDDGHIEAFGVTLEYFGVERPTDQFPEVVMETWDAYNRQFEKIEGVTLARGTAIPDGIYHLVSDIIVRHVDGDYLLMQRAPSKHYGGMWEATAGGSALQGEDALTCARRELQEETGLREEDLKPVGQVIHDENHTLYVEFLCVTDCAKDSIVLQEGETSAYRWVSRGELLAMKRDELVTERMQGFLHELEPVSTFDETLKEQ